MKNRISHSFKHHLQNALQKKFNKKITSSFLALQFTLVVEEDLSISRETARKWLNGQAIPEITRLKILLDWLEIDANGFLRLASLKVPNNYTTPSYFKTLNDIVQDLDEDGKKLVIYTAWSLNKTESGNKQNFEDFYNALK